MYSDVDGAATKSSQEAYTSRKRTLVAATFILSWIGLAAAFLNGEYTREQLHFRISLEQTSLFRWSVFLWPLLSLHSLGLHWKDDPIELYAAGLRGALLSGLILFSRLPGKNSQNGTSIFPTSLASLQIYDAALLTIVQLLFPRRPDLFAPEGKSVDLEDSASALRKYSMQWCLKALTLAGKQVSVDQLPILDYLTRSKSQAPLIINSPGTTLWSLILAERFIGLAKQWILMVVRSVLTFGSPFCVMRLLQSLDDRDGPTKDHWIWLIGIAVSSTCQTVSNYHLIWIQWSQMGIPIRAQLILSLYEKLLRIKDSKDQKPKSTTPAPEKPEVINLVASDSQNFSRFSAINYIIPAAFIRFFFAILFLFKLLGWQSCLVGMVTTVLCLPVNGIIGKEIRAGQKRLTVARDRKTKAVSEALHALRQIKFSALESQWEERIEAFRQEEIKLLRRCYIVSNLRSVWGLAAPFIVAATSICTYAYVEGSISPTIIFPMIEVLPHLQGPLGFMPIVLQDYFAARLNASRMETFLRRPEQENILGPSPSGRVSFQIASIAWPSSASKSEFDEENEDALSRRFSLHDINLEFPTGELSVIYGKTGSGKSLLVAAVIGEVEILGGCINAPSVAEGQPVAYVSQTIWLQDATIKANILFGSLYNKQRYEKVLAACALGPDLAALPKGDETQIGLRGVKLSGGQRARVAFGRALYSGAQLLVLDDIFSALDSHVAKDIFNALTGELCQGRTRILVTHRVALCLPKTKYVVQVRNNTVGYAGNPEYFDERGDVINSRENSRSIAPENKKPTIAANKNASKSKIVIKISKKSIARTDLKVYKGYFLAAGGLGFTVIYFFGLIVKQLLIVLNTWLLGRINSLDPQTISHQPEKDANSNNKLEHHILPYLLSSLLAIVLDFLFNIYIFSASVRAAQSLFREITFKVIRMPLLWLDTTPVGEMLKRFTVDAKIIDDKVLVTIAEFTESLVKLTIAIGVGLYTSKHTSVLTIAVLLWCSQISRSYIKARTMVKNADAGPTADILEHLTSSAAGISTIRAFGAVDKAIEQMHQHVDRLSTARRHFWIFNRWLGLQMSLAGILFSTGTGIILLSSKSVVNSSLVGLSLTFSMGFSKAIFSAVNNFGILESYMDATAAILDYSELEAESQGGDEVPENWPSAGKVEVRGLEVTYSADLPSVLREISFTVEAGKRIGIVGRTGAGKSSLTLALLRLLEPKAGSIHIDGIDISTIRLQSLRSRIAFIPQDPVLFSGTVRSNLDYFHKIPDDNLIAALRRVKLLAEEGNEKSGLFNLDSPISAGGANMSQGQRQLLCLARAFIKNPKIIVLDEATSAVDNKTDLLIQETIRNEFNKTLIVVAHRLRTIALFDQILVMSEGRIAESGSPRELIGRRGSFYDLVQDSEDRDYLGEAILRRSGEA